MDTQSDALMVMMILNNYADCAIGVNTNPVPNPTNIGVEKRQYYYAVNITWSFASDADTFCVKELVVKIDGQENDVPKNSTYVTVSDHTDDGLGVCVLVASKSYENVTNKNFTGPQCVLFSVPLQPTGLKYDKKLATAIWDVPDRSRPGVIVYFIASNITDNDDDNDNDDTISGANGESPEDMDKGFKFISIPGDQYRKVIQGAVVGNYYTIKLYAENCCGDSSIVNYTFQVTRPTDKDTPEPSASPTMDDDVEFPTWAIAVIVVIRVMFLVGILLTIFIPIICCCCCGTILCCAAAEGRNKDIETGRKGTHL